MAIAAFSGKRKPYHITLLIGLALEMLVLVACTSKSLATSVDRVNIYFSLVLFLNVIFMGVFLFFGVRAARSFFQLAVFSTVMMVAVVLERASDEPVCVCLIDGALLMCV